MLHLNVIPALVLSMALVPSGLPLQQDLLTLPPIQTHGRETTITDKESHDALSLVSSRIPQTQGTLSYTATGFT